MGFISFATEGSLFLLALTVAATLTATSVGITARVLSELKKLNQTESKIILGAAVIDDVLGLIILAVVSGIIATTGGTGSDFSISIPSILIISAKAFAPENDIIWVGFTSCWIDSSKMMNNGYYFYLYDK